VVQDSLTVWLKDRLTGLPLVLDQRGLRHSVVGRIGDGPGELRLPRGIFAKGDSLAFSDSWRPNLELFDPQLRFVRTIPMPMTDLSQALFMRGDTVVGVGAVATEESFGLPFHVYAPNGRWVRSFGDANRNVDHDFMVRNRRVVASGTDSTFWSARYDSLVFEEWHISGGLVRSVRPSIPWLIPLEQDDPGLGQGPASAQIIDFRVTSPNRLLALFMRPRPGRAPVARKAMPAGPGRESDETSTTAGEWLAALDREMEEVLVAIDPNSGAVLREIPVSGVLVIGFLSDSTVFAVRLNPDGLALPAVHPIPDF
jgi:hypothetical protein